MRGIGGWETGILQAEAEAEWVNADGRRYRLFQEEDQIVKDLSADLNAKLARQLRDVTREVNSATLHLSVRARESRFVWLAPSNSEVSAHDIAASEPLAVRGRVAATIDPSSAAMGRPLDSGYWDLLLRAHLISSTPTTAAPPPWSWMGRPKPYAG